MFSPQVLPSSPAAVMRWPALLPFEPVGPK
jgi:hypothetical protein